MQICQWLLSFLHKYLKFWLCLTACYNLTGGLLAFFAPESLDGIFPNHCSRVLGWWALTTAMIRFLFLFDSQNHALYWLTLLTFISWYIFFISEIWVSGQIFTSGIIMGFISIVWMLQNTHLVK
jgi:hypothetical protein